MLNDRVQELAYKINKARNEYYNLAPQVKDNVFDAWVDELKSLDPNHPAITAIGFPIVTSEWKKAKHKIPMGSLNKVNSPSELSKWASEIVSSDGWFCVEKLDGLSINCVYENGKLVQAISRGNGEEGEDIYANVIKMGGIRFRLMNSTFSGSLRGEIILKKSKHQKYFSDKANPRNAASGVSKRLDGVGVEHLDILLYQVIGDVDFETEIEQFRWLKNYGFNTPNYWLFNNVDEVNVHWRDYQDSKRDKLDYIIDGLVVRVNALSDQAILGEKDLRPKGALAFKFDNESRETIVRDIIWQVGNSGRLTPVAVIDPVNLVGATISRASLYNLSYIQDLGLDIGAKVLVSRRNDVIPRVEEVIEGVGTIACVPKYCPECASELQMIGENCNCMNMVLCPAQVVGRIKNWISGLNLLDWGDILISRLVETKRVNTIADLYKLTVDDLASLDRMGKKSAKKCYDILWANNEIPLDVFLGSLSIPMIGSSMIRLIMNAGIDNLDKFFQVNVQHLEQIVGVGPVKAKLLVDGLNVNKELIGDLLKNGVKMKEKKIGSLSGTTICFTGKAEHKRADLEKMAADAGADVKSAVGPKLSYLVIADVNSTSSKAVTARKLGTKLISEQEFLNLLKANL